jgi:DNA-damage-inducible protein J
MDEQLKQQAEALFADMGMNMTTAITVFTKAAIRQGKIPFEIAGDPFFNETNQAHLRAAIERVKRTGGTEHEIIEEHQGLVNEENVG